MSRHNPLDWLATQRPVKHRLPHRLHPARFHPRVNQSPTIAVIQHIDVDVIQFHRQRQPQPMHPLRNFDHLAIFRGRFPRVSYRCHRLGLRGKIIKLKRIKICGSRLSLGA